MAIKRQIPRDIMKYKTKIIGGLTARQIVCFVPGSALAIGAFFLFKPLLGEGAALPAIIVGLPFFLCGGLTMYGVPFEKFIGTIYRNTIATPPTRKYKTESVYSDYLTCEKPMYRKAGTETKNTKPDKATKKR